MTSTKCKGDTKRELVTQKLVKGLHDLFGFETFRNGQLAPMVATMMGYDVYAQFPTGFGKSLIYILTGLVCEGLTVNISPLISLMKDQVENLNKQGHCARRITSEQPTTEKDEVFKMLQHLEYGTMDPKKELKFLYMSPERLANPDILNRLLVLHECGLIARFVIDEAHCICTFANFRTDYQNLNIIKKNFKGVPILATTATAGKQIRRNIIQSLGMKDCKVFESSVNRSNIHYRVKCVENQKEKNLYMAKFIKKNYNGKCGLVYATTTKACEVIALALCKLGVNAEYYHGKLSGDQRNETQNNWINGTVHVIVCTNSFAMGVDKKDVRFVIHNNLANTMESYVQASGRGGRDGKRSDALILFNYADKSKIINIVINEGKYKENATAMRDLGQMVRYCTNNTTCRRKMLSEHFGQALTEKCNGTCDNCEATNTFKDVDITDHTVQILTILSRYGGLTMTGLLNTWMGEKAGSKYKKKVGNMYGSCTFINDNGTKRDKLARAKCIIIELISNNYITTSVRIIPSHGGRRGPPPYEVLDANDILSKRIIDGNIRVMINRVQ
jgi:bloom syndrome protein